MLGSNLPNNLSNTLKYLADTNFKTETLKVDSAGIVRVKKDKSFWSGYTVKRENLNDVVDKINEMVTRNPEILENNTNKESINLILSNLKKQVDEIKESRGRIFPDDNTSAKINRLLEDCILYEWNKTSVPIDTIINNLPIEENEKEKLSNTLFSDIDDRYFFIHELDQKNSYLLGIDDNFIKNSNEEDIRKMLQKVFEDHPYITHVRVQGKNIFSKDFLKKIYQEEKGIKNILLSLPENNDKISSKFHDSKLIENINKLDEDLLEFVLDFNNLMFDRETLTYNNFIKFFVSKYKIGKEEAELFDLMRKKFFSSQARITSEKINWLSINNLLLSIGISQQHTSVFDEYFLTFKVLKEFIELINRGSLNQNNLHELIEKATSFEALVYFISNTPENLNFINSVSHDYTSQIWHNYVVRKDDWSKMYRNSNQEAYGHLMHFGIKVASLGLMEQNWDFPEVIDFLRFHRQRTATVLNQEKSKEYGLNRNNSMFTYLDGPYAPIADYFREKSDERTIILSGEIENQKIILETILLTESPDNITKTPRLDHTPPHSITPIMKHVEKLFQGALKEDNPDKLMEELGKIFWWICHAKPWRFGDPSIAEMLVRAVIKSKGLPNNAWQVGLVPWSEAMKETDVNAFAKNFHTMFEKVESS